MSISYVSAQSCIGQYNSATVTTSFTATGSTAVSAGSLICVYAAAQDTNGNSFNWGITDNASNSYTAQSLNSNDVDGVAWAAFTCVNSIGSPTQFTITSTANSLNWVSLIVDVFTGVASVDTHQTNTQNLPGTGTDAITTGSFTPAAAGELLWAGCNATDVGTVSGTGFTSAQTGTSFVMVTTEYILSATGSAQAATFTNSTNGGINSNNFDTVGVFFKPAIATTYVPSKPRIRYIPNRVILRH